MRYGLIGALMLALFGFSGSGRGGSVTVPGTGGEAVTITFIHHNDLHAHLVPHADAVPDAPLGKTAVKTTVVERGGLARIATVIKRIRAQNRNSILMNIGDTYHGGVEALFTQGNAVVEPVNALGIDVGVPGWDFAYGPLVTRLRYTDLPMAEVSQMMGPMRERMEERGGIRGRMRKRMKERGMGDMESLMPFGKIKRPDFPNLAANVTFTMPPRLAGRTLLPATLLKEVGGINVGFIGITSDIVPYMHPMMAFGLSFLEGEDKYKTLINKHAKELKSKGAQLVVVMSELGIQKDFRLAQIVNPGVDVFFSAHTHEATFEPLTSASGALVVEAGNDGYVGRMDITVQDGKVISRNWQLLPVGRDIPEDSEMKALVDKARAPFLARDVNMRLPRLMGGQALSQPITTVVGKTAGALDRRHALESSFNNAFTDLLRRKSGTQVTMTPGFRFDAVIVAPGILLEDNTVAVGNITLEDVYRFFPVPYTIATAQVSGRRLREILEQVLVNVYSADVFRQKGGWFDGFSGLSATLDLSNPDGRRIAALKLKDTNQELANDSVLAVTGCSRPLDAADVLCSHPGFSAVKPFVNPVTGTAWTPVDIFVDALAQRSLPAAARRDLGDLNRTPVWPQTPFVQPLRGVGKQDHGRPAQGASRILVRQPASFSKTSSAVSIIRPSI